MPIPLSLYIHVPWCVRKCPYCDFNSHQANGTLPETEYVNALLDDLEQHLALIQNRALVSIFFGGGTPSLFSAEAIAQILSGVKDRIALEPQVEITLEANPGTIDQDRFRGFYQAGVNRLSIGIQSLQDEKLKTLGRIHDREHALNAITIAKQAGFENFNVDLMYGLPTQSIADALEDLQTVLTLSPPHLSWYQLTIEPNTVFYKQTPVLPPDDVIWDTQQQGQALLKKAGLNHYEVSAYALPLHDCVHNCNYWEFGDYLGIGAGAHSKVTDTNTGQVQRFAQVKQPRDYLDKAKRNKLRNTVLTEDDLIFEFMLNALRLTHGFKAALFTERTGLPLAEIEETLAQAKKRGLLSLDDDCIMPSEHGKRFLNNLMQMFLV